ncbi:MAG: cation transporter dimerization domain-containing protein [Capnocytophaga sp.]|nr:cation transporter dimerization domain-containing protein [Capnocytophaga sp.]
MDENNYSELTEKINAISREVNGVIGIEKCYIRKVGMHYCVDIHLVVSGNISVKEGHDIAHQLKDVLCKKIKVLHSILIHIEPDYKDIILKK